LKYRWLFLLLGLSASAEAQWIRKLHPDSLLNMNLRFIPTPILFRSPETSWGYGLGASYYFNTARGDERLQTRSSNTQFQVVRTFRQQSIGQILTDIFTPEERFYIHAYLGYRDYLDRFYGIGNATAETQKEDYRFAAWVGAASVLYRHQGKSFIGLNIRFQQMYNIRPTAGGALDTGRIPGSEGSKLLGFGPEWQLDKRDNPFAPAKGYYINTIARYQPAWQNGWFSFGSFRLDARYYRDLGREQVFASRIVFNQQMGQAPFRELAMIGGDKGLRGYFFGRYRDRSMFELHTEYRFPIWKIFRGAVFTGIGQLGEHPGQYFDVYWKGSYGAGLRILANKKERITLRIDYGRTLTGQSGVYLEFNEAF